MKKLIIEEVLGGWIITSTESGARKIVSTNPNLVVEHCRNFVNGEKKSNEDFDFVETTTREYK